MKNGFAFAWLSVIFLTACGSTPQSIVTEVPQAVESTARSSLTPTQLQVHDSAPSFTQSCMVIQNAWPKSESLSGYLIAKSDPNPLYGKGTTFAVNLENQEKILLLSDDKATKFEPSSLTISPDRNWLMYFKVDLSGKNYLHLGTAREQDKYSVYWDDSWDSIGIWLNEKELLIPPSMDNQRAFAFNPFTSETKELNSEFPSGLNFTFPFFYYDPTLSKAVYISGDNYILWDANSNTDIWLKSTNGPYLAPKWSQDGKHVAMIIRNEEPESNTVHDELVLVDREGNENNITDFRNHFSQTANVHIANFEWSPDNQHMAILLEVASRKNDPTQPTLIIMNTLSNQTIDLCIPIVGSSNLAWSPSGNQVAINVKDVGQSSKTNQEVQMSNIGVIIDLTTNVAAKTIDNAIIVGWTK
jgi:hypothetical protein